MAGPKKPKKVSLRGKIARIREKNFTPEFKGNHIAFLLADGKKAFHIPSLSTAAQNLLVETFGFVKMGNLLVESETAKQLQAQKGRPGKKRKALPAPQEKRLSKDVFDRAARASKRIKEFNQQVLAKKIGRGHHEEVLQDLVFDVLHTAGLIDVLRAAQKNTRNLTHAEFNLEGTNKITRDQEKVLRVLGFTQRGHESAKGKYRLRLRNVLW